jgi:hypothetical protein
MKLYAYCLTEGIDSLPESPNGINGAAVYLFKVGKFSLLVSVYAGDTVPVSRDNALTHAAVVHGVLSRTTPLPFRFGTLVTEPQLESYVTARSAALQAKLNLVRGCVEMGVKIIWDREWSDDLQPNDVLEGKPGTAFLKEKRRELLGSEARADQAKRIVAWLEERLGEAVRDTTFETNFTGKILVTAAHLVERDSLDRYRTALKEAKIERPELHFLASGPWPPYSFANIDLEFKTQFGVS